MSSYNELAQFDQDAAPAQGRRQGLENLADGDYDLEITSAELVRTDKQNELILRVGLKVATTGQTVEYAYFFRTQQNVNFLIADLCTLGLDADQWKPPARPFSQELPKFTASLRGVRFRGKKVSTPSKDDPNKPYHNLYVNQRLTTPAQGSSGLPAAYTPEASPADPIPW